jgi:hypothetical protein
VWIAPWLAALTALALRGRGLARWRWAALAGATWLVFAAGPSLALVTGSERTLDLITDVPMKQPLSWTGADVLAGNAYVLAGLAGLLALFGWGVARAFAQPLRARLTGSAPAQPHPVSSQAD